MVEGDNGALQLRALQRLLPLHSLLFAHLLVIELSKVVYNNGNGQGNNQYTAHGTRRPNDLSQARMGTNVPVAHRTHRDNGPPERLGDAAKQRVLLVLLRKVAEAGEDEDAHGEEEHEQAQLLVAVLQREAEGLEAGGVARQLEDTQDPHDAKHLDDAADLLKLFRVLVGLDEEEGDKVGEDGEHVDDVHAALDKGQLVGRGGEAQNEFQGEPGDADRLDHGQLGVVHLAVVEVLAGDGGDGVEREGHCGQHDETDRDDGHHLNDVCEGIRQKMDPGSADDHVV